MVIKNAYVYGIGHQFRQADLCMEGERIADRAAVDGEETFDAEGLYALPGLLDLHFHGAVGCDLCDADAEGLRKIAKFEAQHGVLAICPATVTSPEDLLTDVMKMVASYRNGEGADVVGVNMEGPFISREKKGAQNEAYIRACDSELCLDFVKASGGLVKLIGLAPEANPGFEEYIAAVKDLVHVSLAHTNSDYETARRAFRAGACHAVHLYNAMPEMTHRNPGVVGAVFDSPHVMAELICDGNHVHPAVVRSTFAMLGAERIVLISDSLRATGLGDGLIDLGGQAVQVEGTRATLVDGGNLAGSVTCLTDCLRIAVKEMGVPLCDAVRCASENPARAIGEDRLYGTIEAGKKGNLLLLREDLSTAAVFKDGVCILNRL